MRVHLKGQSMTWTQWTITHFAVRLGCAVATFTTFQLRKADVTAFSHRFFLSLIFQEKTWTHGVFFFIQVTLEQSCGSRCKIRWQITLKFVKQTLFNLPNLKVINFGIFFYVLHKNNVMSETYTTIDSIGSKKYLKSKVHVLQIGLH